MKRKIRSSTLKTPTEKDVSDYQRGGYEAVWQLTLTPKDDKARLAIPGDTPS